jgi:hypothetical protein
MKTFSLVILSLLTHICCGGQTNKSDSSSQSVVNITIEGYPFDSILMIKKKKIRKGIQLITNDSSLQVFAFRHSTNYHPNNDSMMMFSEGWIDLSVIGKVKKRDVITLYDFNLIERRKDEVTDIRIKPLSTIPLRPFITNKSQSDSVENTVSDLSPKKEVVKKTVKQINFQKGYVLKIVIK